MKVFIDCGAYRGEIIKKFIRERRDWAKFRVYAFECNPLLKNFQYPKGVFVINKAVWIREEKLPFYLSSLNKGIACGSSVYKNKLTGNLDKAHPVMIDTIDFSKWLLATFKIGDYVIIKMNIEGSEYAIVPELIKTGAIKLISELHILWHWKKIKLEEKKHIEIENSLRTAAKECGCKIFDVSSYKHIGTGR